MSDRSTHRLLALVFLAVVLVSLSITGLSVAAESAEATVSAAPGGAPGSPGDQPTQGRLHPASTTTTVAPPPTTTAAPTTTTTAPGSVSGMVPPPDFGDPDEPLPIEPAIPESSLTADDCGRPIGEGPQYNGTLEDRDLIWWCPKNPFRVTKYPVSDVPVGLRGILLTTTTIELVGNGQLVESIPFPAGGQVTFDAVVAAIGDPLWVDEVEPGVFVLKAAFVQGPGTDLLVSAPEVTEVRLEGLPAVFWGGLQAAGHFDGVRLTSWDSATESPIEYQGQTRPFVLYQDGATLDIIDSEMLYLGGDVSPGGYGVSWRLNDSTGTVTGSTFAYNYFGLYTFEAVDMLIKGNVFRDNVLYGADPHDYSERLVIEDNEAFSNGRHGIIVSRHVIDSVIRNNHSYENAVNGIVLDTGSNNNLIESNLVENNLGDGIALIGSGSSRVVDNDVIGHRTGIRIHGEESDDNVVTGNRLSGNDVGIEAYGGAERLEIISNSIDDARIGLLLDAPEVVIRSVDVVATERGLELRENGVVDGLVVTGPIQGVVIKADRVELGNLDVSAEETALHVTAGSKVSITDSTLIATEPVVGEIFQASNVQIDSTSPVPLIAWVGFGLVPMALGLEGLRHWYGRQHRDRDMKGYTDLMEGNA